MNGQSARKKFDEVDLTPLERAAGYSHASISNICLRFKVTPDEVRAALDSYLLKTRHPVPGAREIPKRPRGRVNYQRWTDDEVAALKRLIQQGYGPLDIAKKLGRSDKSVMSKARVVSGGKNVWGGGK